MVVGICQLDIRIHGNNSLKGKRQVIKQIVDRTKTRFNVSIAEVGDHDLWQRTKIGFSIVGNDRRHINSRLDTIKNFIEQFYPAEIIDSEWEILNY
ncbi:MAG: DUF503 domain-containing protein [Deltaproteobacteria bacterium]|mgnify:CR=1 FL=1|nr:MAG: DUF503 domain-containing protein [Deltaproteobacteria bacterium]